MDRSKLFARFATGAIAAIVVATILPAIVLPSDASAATARIGAFGTATIDGVSTPGEWDAADAVALDLRVPATLGGGPTQATVFILNDARNLYAALRVSGVYNEVRLVLAFDDDHDRNEEQGEDILQVVLRRANVSAQPLPFYDQFRGSGCSGPCDDTHSGGGNPPPGTTDGRAAGGFDLVSGFVELSHPLTSSDAAHDVTTAPGRVVGLNLSVQLVAGSGIDCQKLSCYSSAGFEYGDLVIATARAPFSTVDEMARAIRIEDLAVTPSATLPGKAVRITYRLVNRSGTALVVPLDPATGRHLGVHVTEWITYAEGGGGPIGARTPGLEPTNSSWSPRDEPVDILARLGGTVWPSGAGIAFSTTIDTAGYGPGSYGYQVTLRRAGGSGPAVRAQRTGFVLKGVRDEWSAKIGTAGRNGAATLRAYTTADGTLAVSLRSLSARRTYPVVVVRGTCAAPVTVARVGSVTTGSTGRATRTFTLSPSTTAMVRSAAATNRLLVRVGTGSAARCGPLVAVPLYRADLRWSVFPLVPAPNAATPHLWPPTDASGLVVLGSRLIVVGRQYATYGSQTGPTMAWSSTDSFNWTSTTLGADAGEPMITTDGSQAVVVGSGMAWRSNDGLTWSRASAPPAGRLPWGPDYGTAQDLVVAPGGFVALLGRSGTGAFDSVAWTSADGDRWVQLAPSPALRSFCPAQLVAGPDVLVAVGEDCSGNPVIVTSVDGGRSWNRSFTGAGYGPFHGAQVTPAGFAAWRTREIWTSADGFRWTRTGVMPSRPGWDRTVVSQVVPFGPGYVAIGGSIASADSFRAEVLVSGDGLPWRWAPWPIGWSNTILHAAVVWQGRLVVLGEDNPMFTGENRALVWRAELASP